MMFLLYNVMFLFSSLDSTEYGSNLIQRNKIVVKKLFLLCFMFPLYVLYLVKVTHFAWHFNTFNTNVASFFLFLNDFYLLGFTYIPC